MKKKITKLLKNKFFSILLFFILLSSIQIFIWFKNGYIYGGGDVGLQTFNPKRIVDISLYPWWEGLAPGSFIPLAITNIPFEFGLSVLQNLSLTNLQLQAITFFLLFFFMGFGMYLFLLTIFNKNSSLSLLGALFYLYNPYMLLIIWHRFVHTSIFFVAALPYMVICWRKWIKGGEFKYLLFFCFINLISSYMFGTLAFIITLWVFLGVLTIIEAVIPFSDKKLFLIPITRFLIGLIIWLLTNTWWFMPLFGASSQYNQQYSQDNNLVQLLGTSKRIVLPYSLQMVNPFNLYEQLDFGSIYNNFFFKLLPWLSVAIVFIGLIKSLKEKKIVSFGLLTLFLIFLTKGASAPFGGLFTWGFNHSFAIGALRNPAEKIGLLLPFVYSVLFVSGFVLIRNYLSKIFNEILMKALWIIILLPNLIFCWPFFSQFIFGNINNPAFVNIPKEYQLVNNFIKNSISQNISGGKGRILHLPLPVFEAVTYNWSPKYRGVDPNILLFDSYASISRNLNLPIFDDYLKGLSFTFMHPYSQNNDAILQALRNYNVDIIVLHKDSSFLTDGIVSPEEIEKLLEKLSFLRRVYSSGNLVVYKINEENVEPKIIISENPSYIRSGENNNVWLFQAASNSNSISNSPDSELRKDIYRYISGANIFADRSFRFYQASSSAILNPDFHSSVIDKLNSVKRQVEYYGDTEATNIFQQFLDINKLLFNLAIKDTSYRLLSLNDYQAQIVNFLDNKKTMRILRVNLEESNLRLMFQEHIVMLEQFKQTFNDNEKKVLNDIIDKLTKLLTINGLFPKNVNLNEMISGIDRQVFSLLIQNSANYEIFMTKAFKQEDFNGQLQNLPFLIDGESVILKSTDSGNTLSFGLQEFNEGIHEISYSTVFSKNLFNSPKEWNIFQGKIDKLEVNLEAKENSPGYIEIPFIDTEGGGLYHFNMDIMLKQGPRFHIQLLQDSDPIENNQLSMQLNQYFDKKDMGGDWRNFNFDANLRMTTKNAKLRIILMPDNSIFSSNSLLSVKNLSVQKVLNNGIFLKKEEINKVPELINKDIKFTHSDPVSYSGEINIEKPSFLFLKETYNKGWILKLKNNKTDVIIRDHFTGNLYGNAWFIEKPGKYLFEIKFDPFKYNTIGLLISSISYLLLIIFVITNMNKRKFL